MAKSLKEHNISRLAWVCIGNLAVFGVLFLDLELDFNKLKQFLPVSMVTALVVVLNGFVGPNSKARLVFWRWKNPLPGSRAFSELAKNDPRIDIDGILRNEDEDILESPEKQNYVWYNKYYAKVKGDPSVMSNHRDYLFTRDYASLSFIFFFPMSFLGYLNSETWHFVFFYTLIMAVQYFGARRAAVTNGERFVTTVLANATTREA